MSCIDVILSCCNFRESGGLAIGRSKACIEGSRLLLLQINISSSFNVIDSTTLTVIEVSLGRNTSSGVVWNRVTAQHKLRASTELFPSPLLVEVSAVSCDWQPSRRVSSAAVQSWQLSTLMDYHLEAQEVWLGHIEWHRSDAFQRLFSVLEA